MSCHALCNFYLLRLYIAVYPLGDRYRCTVSSVSAVLASCTVGGTLTETLTDSHPSVPDSVSVVHYKSLEFLFSMVPPMLWNICFPLMYSQTIIWCMSPSVSSLYIEPLAPEVMLLKLSSLILTWRADNRIVKQKDLLGCGNLVVMSVSWIVYQRLV